MLQPANARWRTMCFCQKYAATGKVSGVDLFVVPELYYASSNLCIVFVRAPVMKVMLHAAYQAQDLEFSHLPSTMT